MLGCDELTTQPGTGAENCIDGEKSPEKTIKALLNNQSRVREGVLVTDCDNHDEEKSIEETTQPGPGE